MRFALGFSSGFDTTAALQLSFRIQFYGEESYKCTENNVCQSDGRTAAAVSVHNKVQTARASFLRNARSGVYRENEFSFTSNIV
jgi:hypothetical protein